jgi:hypothetical protein
MLLLSLPTNTVQPCHLPLVANLEVQKSQNTRGGFALHFFRGGGLRRLVNASPSSFCISASQFELKIDLARERKFHACVLRERE